VTRSEIWLESPFERVQFGDLSSMCTSYTLSCDLPWNEMCVQLAALLESSLFDMCNWVH
jgi:hypothetical protein